MYTYPVFVLDSERRGASTRSIASILNIGTDVDDLGWVVRSSAFSLMTEVTWEDEISAQVCTTAAPPASTFTAHLDFYGLRGGAGVCRYENCYVASQPPHL